MWTGVRPLGEVTDPLAGANNLLQRLQTLWRILAQSAIGTESSSRISCVRWLFLQQPIMSIKLKCICRYSELPVLRLAGYCCTRHMVQRQQQATLAFCLIALYKHSSELLDAEVYIRFRIAYQ